VLLPIANRSEPSGIAIGGELVAVEDCRFVHTGAASLLAAAPPDELPLATTPSQADWHWERHATRPSGGTDDVLGGLWI